MAKSKSTKQEPKSNTFAAKILFAEAQARLEDMPHKAYTWGDESGEPLPRIEIMGCGFGNFVVYEADILEEFWDQGPTRRPIPEIGRTSMKARSERLRLGKESGWVCFYCRQEGNDMFGPDERVWHVDHAYPKARGGDNEPDNLVLSCATCNLSKRAKLAADHYATSMPQRIIEAVDTSEPTA